MCIINNYGYCVKTAERRKKTYAGNDPTLEYECLSVLIELCGFYAESRMREDFFAQSSLIFKKNSNCLNEYKAVQRNDVNAKCNSKYGFWNAVKTQRKIT